MHKKMHKKIKARFECNCEDLFSGTHKFLWNMGS